MSALRFFYKVTMGRQDALEMIPLARNPRSCAKFLTPEEVVRLIEAAPGRKYRCVFSIAYGAGLRSSEVVSLKVSDIDSTRMVLRIEDGKGGKDRLAKLSPQMLKELRAWWKEAKPQGVSVSEPVQGVRPYQCPAISSCLPGSGDQGQDRPLRPSAHAAALVRDTPARPGDRYSRYPSDARTQKVGDDGDLYSGVSEADPECGGAAGPAPLQAGPKKRSRRADSAIEAPPA